MKLKKYCSLILVSALVFFSLTASAFQKNKDILKYNDVIQISVDPIGNYHISFHTEELETSTAQENYDYALYRSSLSGQINGRRKTTEEQVNSFVSAAQYFTSESPRSFTLAPRGSRRTSEEYGEVQSYTFCIYFGPAMKSTSCIHMLFSIIELDLIADFDTAKIDDYHMTFEIHLAFDYKLVTESILYVYMDFSVLISNAALRLLKHLIRI